MSNVQYSPTCNSFENGYTPVNHISRARAPILVILVSLHLIYRNNLFPSFLLQSSVDRMMQRGNASLMVGASSWKDQFIDAFTVQAGKCLLS